MGKIVSQTIIAHAAIAGRKQSFSSMQYNLTKVEGAGAVASLPEFVVLRFSLPKFHRASFRKAHPWRPSFKNKVSKGNKLMESIMERDAFRIEEVAEKLNCSRRFLGKQIALGRLPVVRLSRKCVRVRPEDLDAYLAQRVARGPRSNFAYVS